MKVQHNIPGMNNLNIGKGLNTKMAKNLRRLSTGMRIATAADDAAGLAVSENIRNLISGYVLFCRHTSNKLNVIVFKNT